MKIICLRMQMLLLVWQFTLFYTLTLSTDVREFSFDNKGEKQLGQSLGLRGLLHFLQRGILLLREGRGL